jgi:purine-cytosine permease-like protein
MVLLGSILVPVGGVFLAHFIALRRRVDVEKVYDIASLPSFNLAGIAAWIAGAIVYRLAAPIGATLPALATSIIVYAALARRSGRERVVT